MVPPYQKTTSRTMDKVTKYSSPGLLVSDSWARVFATLKAYRMLYDHQSLDEWDIIVVCFNTLPCEIAELFVRYDLDA